MDEEQAGREVGGYRLLRRIGSGGMGTVYEAADGDGGRVALKLLHPAIAADPQARHRLAREVRLLHLVRDAGVARVLDAETEDGEAFVVTELVDGPTLEDDVAAEGPFSPPELANLAHGLAEALRAIHAVGVVHRDLKPGNVMMSATGPVVIDFGIAQVADDARLTQTGMVTGTPGYLDPELFTGAEPSPACDWWGWAAVLLFAATGRAPFGRGATQAVLARVSTGRADTDGLPAAAARALAAALHPDPAHRLDPEAVLAVLDGDDAVSTQLLAHEDLTRLTEDPRTADGATRQLADGATRHLADGATRQLAGATSPFLDGTRALPGEGAPAVIRPSRTPRTAPPTYAPGAPAFPPGAVPAGGGQGLGGPRTRVLPAVLPDQQVAAAGWAGAGPVLPPHPGPWPPPVEAAPAWAVPPRRRTLTVLALGLGLSAAAVPVPGLFLVVTGLLLVLTATAGWAGRSRRSARLRRGPRPGDDARMLAGLPWHLLRGVLAVLPGVLVGGLLAAGAWWAGTATAAPGTVPAELWPALSRWAAGALLLLVAWLTPTSLAAREGARATLDVLTPGPGYRALLAVVVLGVAAAVGLQLLLGVPPEPVWTPLPTPAPPVL